MRFNTNRDIIRNSLSQRELTVPQESEENWQTCIINYVQIKKYEELGSRKAHPSEEATTNLGGAKTN